MRLLAIDPGLAQIGFAVLDIRGVGDWSVVQMVTVHTDDKHQLPMRLAQIARTFSLLPPVDRVVIETSHNERAYSRARGLSMNVSFMALGAIVASVNCFSTQYVELAPTSSWWPRARGRVKVKEGAMIAHVRQWPQLAACANGRAPSQHAITAVALGEWWHRQPQNIHHFTRRT